jgi:hypothetical protein
MPLARIITDSVDESLELTMQLRSRGFQVEMCAPGEVPGTPVDLEVRLEECNSEDVLMRTAQVSDADDLWVFVAPGALDDSIRPIRTIPLASAPMSPVPEPKVSVEPALKFVPSLVPNITPEDDPIMLELDCLSARSRAKADLIPSNGKGAHAHSVPPVVTSSIAVELSAIPLKRATPEVGAQSSKAEILEFPARPQLSVHVSPPYEKVSDAGPSSDLRFWRIASVATLLAIAALLLGVSWSSRTEPAVSSSAATNVTQSADSIARRIGKASSPVRQSARVPSGRAGHQIPLPAKPSAAGARLGQGTPPTDKVARKDEQLRNDGGKRVAKPSTDDHVARDTVTYFDRKGRPSPKKPVN